MLSNRPYLNPELRRSDLASATGISEHDLSQLFSRHLGTNFYTYVNGFRLAAFEARLTDGSLEQLTMAALAQACGFKSKTSLYRVFREKHETTPGEYLKQRSVGVGR
ncbi:MAG: helix-turn-helix domain-containing protein [Bacteroidota bacterium]